MQQFRYSLLIVCLLGISARGDAQQFSWTNPSGLTLCDSASFEVQVTNDSSLALEGALLEVFLPPCLNLLTPAAISLPTVEPSQTAVFQYWIFAPCTCYDTIYAGGIFANQARLVAWGDTIQLVSNPYPVETAELVIVQTANTFLSGEKGEALTRSFTIQNTRPGALSEFLFEDHHQGGMELSSPQGTVEANEPDYFAIRLTGSDFQAVGDGDALFEQGESIVITENILVTSCGYDDPSSLSQITVSWGCEGLTCQSVFQTALVAFQPSGKTAALEITPFPRAPVCFCAEESVPQGLLVVNTGDEPAYDLTVFIQQEYSGVGLDIASATGQVNGDPVSLNVQGTQNVVFLPPCADPGNLKGRLIIHCPGLAPGDTLLLQWDAWFCRPACSQSKNRWSYRTLFHKSCPPGEFVQSDPVSVVLDNPAFSGQISGNFQLADGQTNTFAYILQYDSLNLIDGQLQIEMSVPCGLVWENNPMLLDGMPPDELTLTSAGSTLLVTALYPLPLADTIASFSFDLTFYCDSLCQPEFACADSTLTSCPQWECSISPGPALPLKITSTLLTCPGLPPGCGLQVCDGYSIPFNCEPDSFCIDTIQGFVFWGMEFERISLGLPDNDDDRRPDGPGFLDPSLLKLKRSIPGDTVQTVISGIVIADQPGAAFGHAAAQISFVPQGADPVINPGMFSPEGIVPLDAKVEIRDASSGQSWTCNGIPWSAEAVSFNYDIDPSSLIANGCPLPPDFQFEHGDSIVLTARHRLDANPVKQSPSAPAPPIFHIIVRPYLSVGLAPPGPEEEPFVCGCDFATWEVSGYEYELLPGVFAIPFCDTSEYQGSAFFRLELGKGNFFPYEYRPLGSVPLFSAGFPEGIEMTAPQLKELRMQTGPVMQGLTPMTGIQGDSAWTFDLAPFQDTLADEGFFFLFQYRFAADCTLEGAYPMNVTALIDFAPGIATPADTVIVEANDNALKTLYPKLYLSNPLPNQLAFDNKGRWDFTLSNVINSVAGQQSGAAPNVWLAPDSPTGQLTAFTLTDTQTGDAFPFIDGIFQLGSLQAGQTRPLQLTALNGSCQEEPLEVGYGFGCEPYLLPGQDACQSDIQYWTVLAPPGGVDFLVEIPEDTCALLCDTIPYHTITVYNTNLGPVCEPWVEAILPEGLVITPGSSELAYPSGGPFAAIGDPVDMGNGVYRWQLAGGSAALAENCMAGLGAAPLHQVSLRFWTETDCSFPINSAILFRAGGERNCGASVNIAARPGPPICIQTEGSGIQTQFQAGLEEDITCQDTALFNLALVHSAITQPTDTVSLLLPPSVTFVPGSSGAVPLVDTVNGRIQLNWGLPQGLAPNTLITFQFQLAGFLGLPCGPEHFWLSAGIQSEAVCAATGDTCSVRVETGTEYLPFEIHRPELEIAGFSAVWQPGDNVHAVLTVENTTGIPAENISVDIFLDTNGDGQGDSLLLSPVIPSVITLDSISFTIPVTLAQACELLAVIDSTGQCLCSYDAYPVDQPVRYFETIQEYSCSGEAVELGQCLPGWTAQWAPGDNLGCDTCCVTQFLAFNAGEELQAFPLNLLLSDGGGCVLDIPFEAGIYPEPGIAYADPVACAGEAVNLVADPGIAFDWQAEGESVGQQQAIAIVPQSTGVYTLSMTDLNGCEGEDSIEITVFPLPLADAGADTVFCPGDVFQLHAYGQAGYAYSWSPGAVFADPAVPNPIFADPQEGSYFLEITDSNGCQSADTIQVGFGELPVIQPLPDTAICLGDTLWLQVSGEFTSLSWAPAGLVGCPDPPQCDSVFAAPQESVLLTVTATNQDQCKAEESLFVTVADESLFTLDTVFTCANEPVWIGDVWTAEEGLYCDTLALASGCLQIFCTHLLVGDTASQVLEETICPGDSLVVGEQWFYEPGSYPVSLSTAQGCDSLVALELAWWELPVYSVLPSDTTIFEGNSVELHVSGEAASYLWVPPDGLDCDTCAFALAAPAETTSYRVFITDENGCVQVLSSHIRVRTDCDPERVQIPNAFTPDGDGVNDSFGMLTEAGKEKVLEMQVWNRWGQMVFHSRDAQARWDGRFRGEPVPSDVYAYRIRVVCPNDGGEEEYVGEVSLIR